MSTRLTIWGLIAIGIAGCASSEPRLMATDRVEVERRQLSQPKFVESTFRCLQEQEVTYQVTEYHGTDPGYGPEVLVGVAVVGGAIAMLVWQPDSWMYVSGAAGYGAYLLAPREGESWTNESTETKTEVVEMDLEACGRGKVASTER